MSFSKIDKRLDGIEITESDVKWISALDPSLSLHGVFYEEESGFYTRVPSNVAKNISQGLLNLSRRCSGGRIRFVTDSPYISIKAALPAFMPLPNMSITLSHGFSLYVDGKFCDKYSPKYEAFLNTGSTSYENSTVYFADSKRIFMADKINADRLCEIYLPVYGGIRELYIGIKEGSKLSPAPEYENKKPFVFYGSSITSGACASRPGNDYVSILGRMLNSDYVNLGFSGCGNCEEPILDYMLSIDASLYAYDYNIYDDRPNRILPDHYDVYKKIRDARPDAAILLYDKPFYEYDTTYERRKAIIRGTYDRARSEGDENVYIAEADELFGDAVSRDFCVADCSHPNDYGFMKMAEAIYPKICDAIKKYNKK